MAVLTALCCIVPCVLIVFSVLDTWIIQPARARTVLAEWARGQGIALQEAELRRWKLGPFGSGFFNSRITFRVLVLDAEGRRRTGFVRAGYKWFGLFVPGVEVVWDEADAPS